MESIATYQIEIIDTPFEFEHQKYNKTVVVKTHVHNKLTSINRFGYVTKQEVYNHFQMM